MSSCLALARGDLEKEENPECEWPRHRDELWCARASSGLYVVRCRASVGQSSSFGFAWVHEQHSGEEGPIHVEGLQTFTKLSAAHHAPHTMHTSHITHTHTHTHHGLCTTHHTSRAHHVHSRTRHHMNTFTSSSPLHHSLTATHSLARSLTLLSSITSLLFMNGKLCMWGYPVL